MWCKLLDSTTLSFCVNPFPTPLGSVSRVLHFHLQLMRIKRGSLSAHLKVISKGIDINKPLDRFLPAQSLPGCLSKPNAKSRWEASIKCSEGRWRVQEESCLSHDAQQLLNARQTSTDWEVSSETQMCEKERESEGESHTSSYFFSVYKNCHGVEAGSGCLWKRHIQKPRFVSRIYSCWNAVKSAGFCCNATTLWLGSRVHISETPCKEKGEVFTLWDAFCCAVMGHHFSLEQQRHRLLCPEVRIWVPHKGSLPRTFFLDAGRSQDISLITPRFMTHDGHYYFQETDCWWLVLCWFASFHQPHCSAYLFPHCMDFLKCSEKQLLVQPVTRGNCPRVNLWDRLNDKYH